MTIGEIHTTLMKNCHCCSPLARGKLLTVHSKAESAETCKYTHCSFVGAGADLPALFFFQRILVFAGFSVTAVWAEPAVSPEHREQEFARSMFNFNDR